jgi:hypothetical protein
LNPQPSTLVPQPSTLNPQRVCCKSLESFHSLQTLDIRLDSIYDFLDCDQVHAAYNALDRDVCPNHSRVQGVGHRMQRGYAAFPPNSPCLKVRYIQNGSLSMNELNDGLRRLKLDPPVHLSDDDWMVITDKVFRLSLCLSLLPHPSPSIPRSPLAIPKPAAHSFS